MSDLPNLTLQQVVQLVPHASDIERVGAGGQKVVFKGTIAGEQYALKFAKVPELPEDLESEDFPMSDVAVRRNVKSKRCETVRLGTWSNWGRLA